MSYEEYDDLFLNAQNSKAKYIAFVFDIKSSKKMDNETRKISQLKTFETIDLLIKYLSHLEKKYNKKILLDDFPVIKTSSITNPKNQLVNYLNNPCVLSGDSFVIYCYNNSIEKELFKEIFLKCAKECKNTTKYHFSCGKFETLYYGEGNEKYYIGYIGAKLANDKSEDNIL